jgi:hypothetical protein
MNEHYPIDVLLKKVKRLYESGDLFRSYFREESYFPYDIGLKTIKQSDIQQNFSGFQSQLEKLEKLHLPLEYKYFEFKQIGKQKLPIKIRFETIESYLLYLKKSDEYETVRQRYKKSILKFPQLQELFIQKPKLLLEHAAIWDMLLAVCEFFVNHPYPQCYIRELGIEGVDTKFIEQHRQLLDMCLSKIVIPIDTSIATLGDYGFEKKYGLKYPQIMVHFRILDSKHYIDDLDDMSLPLEALKDREIPCRRVFIVENKITMLSFPFVPDSIVIFGHGYRIGVLKEITWLEQKEIIYWGDIDVDGFAILSQLRGYFSHTVSIFMDSVTFEKYYHLGVYEPNQKILKALEFLNEDENSTYQKLIEDGKNPYRIEQERIPFNALLDYLEKI